MKSIKFILLYILTALPPSIALYLLLEGLVLKVLLIGFLLLWGVVFTHLDKIILLFLNSREVIDTDEQSFFQALKNESYKSFENIPKVYLYSGGRESCFVLESRNEWIVVLERELIKKLTSEQEKALVEFLFDYKKTGRAWTQTKVMGLISLFYAVLYWTFKNIFFLRPNNVIFRSLSIFFINLMRPFTVVLECLIRKPRPVYVNDDLKPLVLQIEKNNFVYTDYLLGHLSDNLDTKSIIVRYLESFPVLENCRFYEAES